MSYAKTLELVMLGAGFCLAINGCLMSRGASNDDFRCSLVSVICGSNSVLEIDGARFNELPPIFTLKPRHAPNNHSNIVFALPVKNISTTISARTDGLRSCLIRMTPSVDKKHNAKLLISRTCYDGDSRVPGAHQEVTIDSSTTDLRTCVVGKNGFETTFTDEWDLVVCTFGTRCLICWNKTTRESIVNVANGGFRRFEIDSKSEGQGVDLICELLP